MPRDFVVGPELDSLDFVPRRLCQLIEERTDCRTDRFQIVIGEGSIVRCHRGVEMCPDSTEYGEVGGREEEPIDDPKKGAPITAVAVPTNELGCRSEGLRELIEGIGNVLSKAWSVLLSPGFVTVIASVVTAPELLGIFLDVFEQLTVF